MLLSRTRHLLRLQNVTRIAVTPKVFGKLRAPVLLGLWEDGRQGGRRHGLRLLQVLWLQLAVSSDELVPNSEKKKKGELERGTGATKGGSSRC